MPDRPLRVSDVMTRQVVTVRPEASVRELARLLSEHQISGVPVVDASHNLLGVVSQTDLAALNARALPPGSDWLDSNACVADIMMPYVFFAHEETGLIELADLMLEKHIHRILVLRGKRLVGIVSSLDLIRALRQQMLT